MFNVENVIETVFKQREFDGKWEEIVRVLDNENAYSYKTESGSSVHLIPTKWITINVYDLELELEFVD